jgi:hypothetical protein
MVVTLSANVTGLGTWFSVTYLWDSQITLVIAAEGTVEVTPVRRLTFQGDVPRLAELEPLDRARVWPELRIGVRATGRPETIDTEAAGEARFLYTAPDAKLEELQLDPDGPGARRWQSMDQLVVLRQSLQAVEPRLELWLDRIWDRARLDDIYLGPLQPLSEVGEGLTVVTAGEAWQNEALQQSLLYGVDWAVLTEEFMGQDIPVTMGRQEAVGNVIPIHHDARMAGYDPERARALLEEAGYGNEAQMVLVISEDDLFMKSADLIAEQMAGIGVTVEVKVIPEFDLEQVLESLAPSGVPAFTLSGP